MINLDQQRWIASVLIQRGKDLSGKKLSVKEIKNQIALLESYVKTLRDML